MPSLIHMVQWIRFESKVELGHAFESRAQTVFIFQLENILRSNWNFLTSYGRSTDLVSGLLWVCFIWLGKNISLKYLLIGGVDVFSTPCPDGVDIAYVRTG